MAKTSGGRFCGQVVDEAARANGVAGQEMAVAVGSKTNSGRGGQKQVSGNSVSLFDRPEFR